VALATSGFGSQEQLVGVGQQATGRPGGAFLSPNGLAGLLAIVIPIALALGLRGPGFLRGPALAGLAVAFLALMLSLSRGGILAVAAALAVMFTAPPFRRAAVVAAV